MTLFIAADIGGFCPFYHAGCGLRADRFDSWPRVYEAGRHVTRFGYTNWGQPEIYTNTSRVAIT